MPSSTGSSGSPTGSNLGTKCVFKKICSWEDANVSAAVLTAGNLFVLFLLNENPIAWIQFGIIFGLLPLGLAARVFGFDTQLRNRLSGLSGGMFMSHGKGKDVKDSSDLIRVSVAMIVSSRMISQFGLPLTIGIVGNTVMLVPLIWSYVDMDQLKMVMTNGRKQLEDTGKSLGDMMHGIHEMMVPIVGGLMTFIVIVGVGKAVDTIFVTMLGLVGYGLLFAIAAVPETVMSGRLVSGMGKSSMTIVYGPEMKRFGSIVNSIVFWESFTRSVAAFLGLYGVYVVSSFTGLAFVVGSLGGLTVTFATSPSIVREKLEAKLTFLVTQVEAKMSSVLTKKTAEEESKPLATESDETVVLVNAQEE